MGEYPALSYQDIRNIRIALWGDPSGKKTTGNESEDEVRYQALHLL